MFIASCGVQEDENIALSKTENALPEVTRLIVPKADPEQDIITSTLQGRSKYVLSPFSKKSLSQVKKKLEVQQKTPRESFDYEIQKGDTLWSIAQKYGIEVEDLAALNKITVSSALKIGRTIKIEKAPTIIEYKVKNGDSLWKIAKKFNVSIQKLTQENKLTEKSTLQRGQVIKIKTFEAIKG
jgi:LysM repeat protein